ncbi:efflux RND transporter permease subunit [Kineobactrum salinum]|uniref:efflux RND transporter permease subunit n=1 Tax=Kineobactrum salinum TaxID=2708301 RepID=UPI0022B29983|nr:efflux RND transporter permease subunit [Kineobactrum salinum]
MLARILYGNSRYFTLLVLVVVAVGLSSLRSIARQEDPTITNFFASVTTFYPGADPARVEALITRPLEDELRKIAEIKELTSTSANEVSTVQVNLVQTLSDTEIARVWSEIRDALSDAASRFPAGASAPVFDDDRLTAYTAIVALSPAPRCRYHCPCCTALPVTSPTRHATSPAPNKWTCMGSPKKKYGWRWMNRR